MLYIGDRLYHPMLEVQLHPKHEMVIQLCSFHPIYYGNKLKSFILEQSFSLWERGHRKCLLPQKPQNIQGIYKNI